MAKEYHKTTNREKRTKSIKKCANLTRFKPRTRRHRKDPLLFYRVAGQPNIHNIPNEILLHIFQYLTQYELWSSVRSVCKLWKSISECACFWQQIEATQEMPLNLLIEWQKAAPGLKLLKIENRNDADFIIEQVWINFPRQIHGYFPKFSKSIMPFYAIGWELNSVPQ